MEQYSKILELGSYIRRFRNRERFIAQCRVCPNFGQSYICPPFPYDCAAKIESYANIRIVVMKIDVHEDVSTYNEIENHFIAYRIEAENELRREAAVKNGMAFGFSGRCPYCKPGNCKRICGEACIHPDLALPSLEAYGFDLSATVSDLFGIEMKWGSDGKLPPYYLFVAGLIY